MNIRKLILIALAVVMALALGACQSTPAATGTTAPAAATTAPAADTLKTIKDGTLMVGMEVGYPPMEYLDADGTTYIGFDVEMAQAIADKLGLELEIVDTAWDGIFASLDSNRYDLIISSVSITPDRQENYNLTEPYVANKLVLVARNDLGITAPDQLAGYKVGVQTETTADTYMKNLMTGGLDLGNDYYVYDKIIQCFDELKLGRLDAVLVDSVVAAYYIGEDSDTYKIVWENDEAEPYGICLKKGNDALTAAVEKAIDEIYAEGKFAQIANKHFGEGNTAGVR